MLNEEKHRGNSITIHKQNINKQKTIKTITKTIKKHDKKNTKTIKQQSHNKNHF